jgi:hypothetical protein
MVAQTQCFSCLGASALHRSDHDTARTNYESALAIYERIREPYSIGATRLRLARLAADDERRLHVDAAKEAWQSIGRSDLIKQFLGEFSGE